MKNLNKVFALFALILGVLVSCALQPAASDDGDDEDIPDGFTQAEDQEGNTTAFAYREITSSSDSSTKLRVSIPSTSYVKYGFSDDDSGVEFDDDKSIFNGNAISNQTSSRVSSYTTDAITKTNILVFFWENYDERGSYDKAKRIIISTSGFVLKSDYTQATSSGKTLPLGYKINDSTVFADYQTATDTTNGGRLLVSFDLMEKSILSTDNSDANPDWVELLSGGSIDTGSYPVVNFAYWKATDNESLIADLDWSKAKRGVIIIPQNKESFDKYNLRLTRQDSTSNLDGVWLMSVENSDGTKQFYPKVLAGATARYDFGNYTNSSYPGIASGTLMSSSPITVSGRSEKYLLVTYWARGKDITDIAQAIFGYVLLSTNTIIPSAKSTATGSAYSSGQNISLTVGQKITAYVSSSGLADLRGYVSTSAVEPSDKATTYSWKVNTVQDEKYSIDVEYTGGTVYLFFWTKDTAGSYSGFFKLIVSQSSSSVTVQSIAIPASLTLVVGEMYTLPLTFNPSNVSNTGANWTTSNSSVATAASSSGSGLITALSAGSATITVTAQDQTNGIKTAVCYVTVTSSAVVTKVNFNVGSQFAGQTIEIAKAVNGVWSDSNKKRAVVASDGRVPIAFDVGVELAVFNVTTNADLRGYAQKSDWIASGWTRPANNTITLLPSGNTALGVPVKIVDAQAGDQQL